MQEYITEVTFVIHTHPDGDDKEPGPIGHVRLISDGEEIAHADFNEAIRDGKSMTKVCSPLRSDIDWEKAKHNLHLMVSVKNKDSIEWQADFQVSIKTTKRSFPPVKTQYVLFKYPNLMHKIVISF